MPTSIRTQQADITTLALDAIVNAANNALLGGGGVDGAIHKAAGPRLLEACKKLNGCPTGEAKLTEGFDLPAHYVIHTVGPVWEGGKKNEVALLGACYRNTLQLAARHGIRTIAFPSISTGAYNFPLDLAAHTATQTVFEVLTDCDAFEEISFCCFSDTDLEVYQYMLGPKR